MKRKNNPTIGMAHFKLNPAAKKLILGTLKKGRLSPGPITARFESEFARSHGARFGVFTNSGTSALQIAVHALKEIHQWKDGDEVLVPAITFIATSNVVIQNQLRPIFVDVDPNTYNIDPLKIEKHISTKTRAIIPVHLFGLPADMAQINKIARKHKLKIIEDSCECMGVNYQGQSVGSLSDIGCFSTYIAHILVTGVGGLAITNNPRYAIKIKSLMNHGRDSIYLNIDDDKEKKGKELFSIVQKRFSFVDVGYSYRATEVEAALGLVGLKDLPNQISYRQKIAGSIIEQLKRFNQFFRLPFTPQDQDHAFMMFPITIIDERISRDKLVAHLENNGIETRYAMPLINQPVYIKLFGDLSKKYPVASYINKNSFYFGLHEGIKKKQIDHIIETFSKFLKKRKLI